MSNPLTPLVRSPDEQVRLAVFADSGQAVCAVAQEIAELIRSRAK
ncbi:MAG: hypothetical protein RL091_1570, partial [Verrucomicrobiota bacterium]